jgi:hypothetical protein
MTTIRAYQNSDFNEICSWWETYEAVGPQYGMMVEDGTFVVEKEGVLLMTMTVFLTQSKQIAYFEGFCVKPGTSRILSHELGTILWDHCYRYAKEKGYKRVIIFTDKTALCNRYLDLGMSLSMSGVYALRREL